MLHAVPVNTYLSNTLNTDEHTVSEISFRLDNCIMLTFSRGCLPPADMDAQSRQGFQDPLSAAVEESERASVLSEDKPAHSSTLSVNRPAADGSEGTEKTVDFNKNDATDSSSTWSPEVLQPDFKLRSFRAQ